MCETGGKHDLVVEVNAEKSGGSRSAFTPPSLWANYAGLDFQNWKSSVAYGKVHVMLSRVAGLLNCTLCLLHSWPLTSAQTPQSRGKASPRPPHRPVCSSAKSRHLGQNTWDYKTLLLHIHVAHVMAEHRAHKGVGQREIAPGYVSTLRTEKKARNHFLPGGNTAFSTYFSSSPAATLPLPSSCSSVGSCWGSRTGGTAHPAQGS